MKALTLDVDGTLAETEELYRRLFAGLPWFWDRERSCVLLGTTGGKERSAIRRGREAGCARHPGAAWRQDRALHRADARRRDEARPGVPAVIEAARRAGLRNAVATTTSRPNVEALSLAPSGQAADKGFGAIAAGDENPAPDVYRLAFARLGVTAEEAAAFAHPLNGLCPAQVAGPACVAAPGAGSSGEDLSAAGLLVDELSQVRLDDLAVLLRCAA